MHANMFGMSKSKAKSLFGVGHIDLAPSLVHAAGPGRAPPCAWLVGGCPRRLLLTVTEIYSNGCASRCHMDSASCSAQHCTAVSAAAADGPRVVSLASGVPTSAISSPETCAHCASGWRSAATAGGVLCLAGLRQLKTAVGRPAARGGPPATAPPRRRPAAAPPSPCGPPRRAPGRGRPLSHRSHRSAHPGGISGSR